MILVEPVEVDVPDALLAQLSADAVCWLDRADFEGGRGLDDGAERGERAAGDDDVAGEGCGLVEK